MFSLIILFRTGGGRGVGFFFRILWKKRIFGGKTSGELSERDSTFPEGLFEERNVFPKTFPINKSFQTFSIILFFCRFLACLSKRRPCVQMNLLRKSLFEQLFVYDFFSELEQIFVVPWQQYFNRLSKMRFICLEQFFHGDFFTWKVISNWKNFFWNRAICFRKN